MNAYDYMQSDYYFIAYYVSTTIFHNVCIVRYQLAAQIMSDRHH